MGGGGGRAFTLLPSHSGLARSLCFGGHFALLWGTGCKQKFPLPPGNTSRTGSALQPESLNEGKRRAEPSLLISNKNRNEPLWDFPGRPGVKTLPSDAEGAHVKVSVA